MDCDKAKDLLLERYDDGLGAPSMASVREHLAGCPACRAEHESLVRVGELLRLRAKVAESAADAKLGAMWTRVRAGIDEERRVAAHHGPAWLRWLWVPAVGGALAVLLLLFYPSVSGKPFQPSHFDVAVEDLESESATVALIDKGADLPKVIWIIDDGGKT